MPTVFEPIPARKGIPEENDVSLDVFEQKNN